jgi:hypothetical protein
MNIFELIFFIANCAIGAAIARTAFHHWGWVGGVLGFTVGFAIIPVICMLPIWSRRKPSRKDLS